MSVLGGISSLPSDAVGALRLLGRLSHQLDRIAASTRALPQMGEAIAEVRVHTELLNEVREHIASVAAATEPLPEVQRATESMARDTRTLARVEERLSALAEATEVLPEMAGRMATIEASMPVLVDVQQQLSQLPETIATVGAALAELTALMTRLLASIDDLNRGVEPLARIADRVPGVRR